MELCHCGRLVVVHADGFTRGLCAFCDSIRCDCPDPYTRVDCVNQMIYALPDSLLD